MAADARENAFPTSAGATHYVVTGIYVSPGCRTGAARYAVETTAVTFARLDQKEIDAYVTSGEPFDKAGGYAIQGRAGRYIPRVEGCYFNVVGFTAGAAFTRCSASLGWRDDGPA